MNLEPEERIGDLGIWRGSIDIVPLAGGITNRNYLVRDKGRRFVVRLGADIAHHHISRANELAASKAAHLAGLSPAVVHHQPGILVLEYVDGRTLAAEDLRNPATLARVVALVRRCHLDVARHLRGPAAMFWAFHLLADYAASLSQASSPYSVLLAGFAVKAGRLERAAGPFDIAFGHNDLLANNFLDDGDRLWMIDWDYAGFNTPLFDLGGLASNNGLSPAEEAEMLRLYFDAPAGRDLWRRYEAMKCVSLLRETMWSMISEIHSTIDFDYPAYTAENLARFERAYELFENAEVS